MDTVVTTMTSTESQLKELEKQALQLQRMAEEEAQAKAAQEAAAQKQAEQATKEVQAPAQQVAPANNGGQAQKKSLNKKHLNKKHLKRREKPEPTPGPVPDTGVIGKAKGYLGLPYVWGSASPSNGGFDCSGFISYIFGVGRQDVAGYWNSVSRISSPQPGDLVFFQGTYKAGPSHIGIYVGNGQMIHASDKGIAYGDINSSYNKKHFLGYGRF